MENAASEAPGPGATPPGPVWLRVGSGLMGSDLGGGGPRYNYQPSLSCSMRSEVPGDTSSSQVTQSLWFQDADRQIVCSNLLCFCSPWLSPKTQEEADPKDSPFLRSSVGRRRSPPTTDTGATRWQLCSFPVHELAHCWWFMPCQNKPEQWSGSRTLELWGDNRTRGERGHRLVLSCEGDCLLARVSSGVQLNDEKKLHKQLRPHHWRYCSVYAALTPQWDACRQALQPPPHPPISHYIMNDHIG